MKRNEAVFPNPTWLLFLAAVLMIFSCAGGYGRMQKRPEVTAAFLEQRLSPDYRYYYIGRDNLPYAIIGIKDGYQLKSRFWKPIDPDSEAFREMVQTPYGYQENQVRGAYLIGPDGNRVGLWYSAYDFAQFRVTEDKEVYVDNPYSPTDDAFTQNFK